MATGSLLQRVERLEAIIGIDEASPRRAQEAQAALNEGRRVEGRAGELARKLRLARLEMAAADADGGTPQAIIAGAGLRHLTIEEQAFVEQLAGMTGHC